MPGPIAFRAFCRTVASARGRSGGWSRNDTCIADAAAFQDRQGICLEGLADLRGLLP